MTTALQLMSKLSRLTEPQQRAVLAYVDQLAEAAKKQMVNPHGVCADLRSDLPFEDFQKNRQEIWGNATALAIETNN